MVGLFRVGLLRGLLNLDHSVVDPSRFSAKHAFVQLAADTMWGLVVNQGVVVEVLFAIHQVEAVEAAGCTRFTQFDFNVIPNPFAAQPKTVAVIGRIPTLSDVDSADFAAQFAALPDAVGQL